MLTIARGLIKLLLVITCLWSSPVSSLNIPLISNLSVGAEKFASETVIPGLHGGFQVLIYDYLQIDVQPMSAQLESSSRQSLFDFCVHSNLESTPVHLALSVGSQILNYEKVSVSRYSFDIKTQRVWRNSRDYFDYLISSGSSCSDQNRIRLGYMVTRANQGSKGQRDFTDTITLTVRPE